MCRSVLLASARRSSFGARVRCAEVERRSGVLERLPLRVRHIGDAGCQARRCGADENRPASVRDIDEVASIRQADCPPCSGDLLGARRRRAAQAGRGGWLSGHDGRRMVGRRGEPRDVLVGTAGWAGGYLRHVHVRSGFERRGIETRLVRHVEAEVERSTRDTEIHVNATRNAARSMPPTDTNDYLSAPLPRPSL
jgi:hypothetical protein